MLVCDNKLCVLAFMYSLYLYGYFKAYSTYIFLKVCCKRVAGRTFRRSAEGSLVFIEGDSSTCVTALTPFQGDRIRKKTVILMILTLHRPRLMDVYISANKFVK